MPNIGPHRFTTTAPASNDLHIVYVGSGGSLRNPKVTAGPRPKSIEAKENRVDVVWEDPLPAGTTVQITVVSDFDFTRPYAFVFTKDGQELGPWTPHPDEDGAFDGPEPRTPPIAPRRESDRVEIVNRRGERSPFSAERLVGSLVLGDREASVARTTVATLTPLLDAVGRSPISTTALRAALAEVLLNPTRPDGTAIRDAVVGDQPDCPCTKDLIPLVGNESEVLVAAGIFVQKVDAALAQLEAGDRLPDALVDLYDEGVAVHAATVEVALASERLCLHPLTGLPVTPRPLPPLRELLRLERRQRFVPKALVSALLAANGETDWEAVAREVFYKVCGVLGLIDFYVPLLEILTGDFADVWQDFIKALAKKRLKKALEILIKRFLTSDKFKELLIKKLGKELGEKIFESIAERLVPFLGWAILIANVIAVIIAQIIYYSSLIALGPFFG